MSPDSPTNYNKEVVKNFDETIEKADRNTTLEISNRLMHAAKSKGLTAENIRPLVDRAFGGGSGSSGTSV